MVPSNVRFSVAFVLCAVGVGSSACNGEVAVLAPDPGTPVGLVEEPESPQQQSDRVDLLFVVDNSSSMSDGWSMQSKQEGLARSATRLIERLVHPLCRNSAGAAVGASTPDARGEAVCPSGSSLEFRPVHDLHVGVLSTSLGNFGNTGDDAVCKVESVDIPSDHAQLVTRGIDDHPIEPGGFLAYGSGAGENSYTSVEALNLSLGQLVRGVGSGCGIEAQLESLYQFLSAPDPWASIEVENGRANYAGSNDAVLAQRRAFLRPDSLVSIVLLTDEDDASVDPLSVGGSGRYYAATSFPNGNQRSLGGSRTAPRGTSACENAPTSEACKSCALAFNSPPDPIVAADPACQDQASAYYGGDEDNINTRFFDMKRRYGVEPRYPVSRYSRGLSRLQLPARDEEHDEDAQYLPDAGTCRNPLFAGALPEGAGDELCNLPAGPRNKSLVFFTVLGGAPNDLLGPDHLDVDGRLDDDTWEKLLGRDFANYDRTGIDPRMLQSITPRTGRPGPSAPDAEPNDPGNLTHRDWDTAKNDLQYACTVPLPEDLVTAPSTRGPCRPGSDAPLCEAGDVNTARRQLRSPSYPTPRPFAVAKALGRQATIASTCPADPAVGYAPALDALVDRMAAGLIK